MDIVIPKILTGAGGSGEAMQGVGRAIQGFGGAVTGMVDKIQAQQDKITAQELSNDMIVTKDKSKDNFLQTQDGKDSTALDTLKKEDERIGQEFIQQAPNNRVGDYLRQVDLSSQEQNLRESQRVLVGKLYNTSVEAVKISTDDSIRESAKTGEYETGLQKTMGNIENQRDFFGANTNQIKMLETQRYTENYLKTSLSNPVTAPLIVQRLSDPEQKNKIFANLDANKIDDTERLLHSAGKDSIRQNAYSKLYEEYGGNFQAMDIALDDPENIKKYGLGMEDAQFVKGFVSRAIEAQDKAQKAVWDVTATNVFLNLSSMKPTQIDKLVQDGKLSYQLGEHFKTDLKSAREGVTDPNTYYRMYTQVKNAAGDPDAMLEVRQNIFGTSGLSFSDKKQMLTMTEGEQDKFEAQVTKRGMDYIQRTVMPSQTMISAAKPMEATKFLEAAKAYDDAIIAAKKKGEKIDGAFVDKTAKEVSQAYTMGVTEQIEAINVKMKEDKKKRDAKKAATTNPQKDQYGFTIGDTKIVKGKTYNYIGNDQWQ
jgi:hypothetical protein